MPVGLLVPLTDGSAKKATAPWLLSEGCSESVNGGLEGSFLGVIPRVVPVKISGANNGSTNATSAIVPALLITGSPNESISGWWFVSTMSVREFEIVKTPLLPSAEAAEKTTVPESLMATFRNELKPFGDVLATVVSGPPLPLKMAAGDPRWASREENATVPAALMEGAPTLILTNPLAVESAIRVLELPSPLNIASEFVVVAPANATIPPALIAT